MGSLTEGLKGPARARKGGAALPPILEAAVQSQEDPQDQETLLKILMNTHEDGPHSAEFVAGVLREQGLLGSESTITAFRRSLRRKT